MRHCSAHHPSCLLLCSAFTIHILMLITRRSIKAGAIDIKRKARPREEVRLSTLHKVSLRTIMMMLPPSALHQGYLAIGLLIFMLQINLAPSRQYGKTLAFASLLLACFIIISCTCCPFSQVQLHGFRQ